MRNVLELPENLPVPQDDGACDHLVGELVPELRLASTADKSAEQTLEWLRKNQRPVKE